MPLEKVQALVNSDRIMEESTVGSIKVAFETLGCRVNQAETECMARQFEIAGYTIVGWDSSPDVLILNSCSVTHIADRKSRQTIRHAHRLNPYAKIVVTGCYAALEPGVLSNFEGVNLVVGLEDKPRLLDLVNSLFAPSQVGRGPSFELIEESRLKRTRGLVKIQDGCNNFCAYCIVPLARGRSRSVPAETVVQEVKALVESGHKEAVLTGVHAGAYGLDMSGTHRPTLAILIEKILAETTLLRLRLSSLEPWELDSSLLELFSDPRLCRHLHLPLQSGSDPVLQRMRRRYTTADFASLVDKVYNDVPGIALTTDVIVGFPGESQEEFEQSYSFCQGTGFAKMHVFKYSPRKGTAAAQMPDQVDERTKSERSDRLIALSGQMSSDFRNNLLDASLDVLWEESPKAVLGSNGKGEHHWSGLTDNYIRVYTASPENLANQITRTRLVSAYGDGLWGSIEANEANCTRREQ